MKIFFQKRDSLLHQLILKHIFLDNPLGPISFSSKDSGIQPLVHTMRCTKK